LLEVVRRERLELVALHRLPQLFRLKALIDPHTYCILQLASI
jgi:hypothetical protein